jgi:hypothetical protein
MLISKCELAGKKLLSQFVICIAFLEQHFTDRLSIERLTHAWFSNRLVRCRNYRLRCVVYIYMRNVLAESPPFCSRNPENDLNSRKNCKLYLHLSFASMSCNKSSFGKIVCMIGMLAVFYNATVVSCRIACVRACVLS